MHAELTPEDFPFDPHAPPIEQLDGLNKLRAIQDRRLAASLFEVLRASEANEHEIKRHQAEAARRKDREHVEGLKALAESCLDGKRGEDAKQLANAILFDGGRRSRYSRRDLEALAKAVRELRRRSGS